MMNDTPNQRLNNGRLESISSPYRERVYTDFSSEITLDPTSREIWIVGPGEVEWQPAGNDAMTAVFSAPNLLDTDIWVTAKAIFKIGTGTSVTAIRVWD